MEKGYKNKFTDPQTLKKIAEIEGSGDFLVARQVILRQPLRGRIRMCAPGEEYAQFRKKRETRKQDQSYDLGLAGIKPCRFFLLEQYLEKFLANRRGTYDFFCLFFRE